MRSTVQRARRHRAARRRRPGPPPGVGGSGHLANFTDPFVDCTNCKNRFRLDKLDDPGHLSELRRARHVHRSPPVQPDVQDVRRTGRGAAAVAYLRPETAQGMFVNFANVLQTTPEEAAVRHRPGRQGVPQRDQPQNWIFRTREFDQMEMEFFVPPADGARWYEYWCQERLDWYVVYGIPAEMLRLRPHGADELSHYSSGTSDVEFLFPWGLDELEGIAQRTDFDLHATPRRRASGWTTSTRAPASGTRRTSSSRPQGRPDDGRLPPRRLRRGRGRTTRRGPCCASTPASPRTRWPCCRCRGRTR